MPRLGPSVLMRIALLLVFSAPSALAQNGSSGATLSGVVTDADGGLVVGAVVVVRNNATGESFGGVTNESGAFTFPGLAIGSYSVTIGRAGFKTAEYPDVRLLAGSANSLATMLEVGPVTEIVHVAAGTDLIRTQTATVSTTITADFIETLPRLDRNALNFVVLLPGVETVGGEGTRTYNDCGVDVDAVRTSTVSGLPSNTINVTIDGVSTSNLRASCDGFYSMVTPRLDAVEEVSLTSATAGAAANGQGAVQIRFVTRSGTDALRASLYVFGKHKNLNSNTYFNRLDGLERLQATELLYGGRIGGPIVIPTVVDGRGRAFFFVNLEEAYRPTEAARERTILRASALDGNFTYDLDNPTTVNLWAIAAASGQTATYDPVILDLLRSIRAAAGTTGTITELVTDPNRAAFDYVVPNVDLEHAPTVNVTVNITTEHRLQGSYYWQRFKNTPFVRGEAEARFPGFPLYGDEDSYRTTGSITLRSVLSPSMVNEVRGGWQWSPLHFQTNATPDGFANQGGFDLRLGFELTDVTPVGAAWPSARNTANWAIEDTANWLAGAHALSFGGSFSRVYAWHEGWRNVPSVGFGVDSANDPAEVLFGTGPGELGLVNFPGSSFDDRLYARDLYALLTGRVGYISSEAFLNEAGTEYVYNGHLRQSQRMDDLGFFVEDRWAWKPNVTITAGLRYQLQLPMTPTSGVFTAVSPESVCGPSGLASGPSERFCNIFNPGVLGNPTAQPEFYLYSAGRKGYDLDIDNFAPAVGVSWRPGIAKGWLRTVLGDPEHATLSVGYSRAFNRERLDRFVYADNPGQVRSASRTPWGDGYPLVRPGESWPLLFRDTNRLGPPDFDSAPAFPLPATRFDWMRAFDANIETPYTDSWSVSFQRSIDRNTAVEVRYIGNLNRKPWSFENWNTENLYETGFLDEFRLAQTNLRANVLAGRGGTFAYFGPDTGTSPLPILLAHFSGLPTARASDPLSYTPAEGGAGAGQWSNGFIVRALNPLAPRPSSLASYLHAGFAGDLFANAVAAGYPTNFWAMNPLVSGVYVMRNFGGSRTNQLIVEVRRRFSGGLAASASYTWSSTWVEENRDLHLPLFDLKRTGVPHALKMFWTYEIPVGHDRRFGRDLSPWIDAFVGGWTVAGTGRVQVESLVLRDVALVGMTRGEAQDALRTVRVVADPVSGAVTLWNMPQDIIDNTRRAFRTDPTSPTLYPPGQEPAGRYFAPASSLECPVLHPGDCGTPELWFNGRWFGEFDFRIAKAVRLPGEARLELGADIFNAFMAKNFPTVLNPSGGPGAFRITDTRSGPRRVQIFTRVTW